MNLYFHSFNQFIHMGHYAAYVWPALSIAGALLIIPAVRAKINYRRIKKTIRNNNISETK